MKKNYIPCLRYKRQSNQVLPNLFLNSNWFHHYLVYIVQSTLYSVNHTVVMSPGVFCGKTIRSDHGYWCANNCKQGIQWSHICGFYNKCPITFSSSSCFASSEEKKKRWTLIFLIWVLLSAKTLRGSVVVWRIFNVSQEKNAKTLCLFYLITLYCTLHLVPANLKLHTAH